MTSAFRVCVLALLATAPGAAARAANPSPVPETPRAMPIEHAVAHTLESRRYRFCIDPKYPLLADEARWCPDFPRSPDPRAARCPALVTACAAGATADLVEKSEPINLHLPDFGGLGRFVLWTLVAGAIALIAFLIVRNGLRSASPRSRADDDAPAPLPPQTSSADDRTRTVVERDVDRLLARARDAAAAGDFAAAVADLHAALLRRLAGDGHVRIQAWATNGDYVRELRGRAPDLAGPVREVVAVVEAAGFGGGVPSERTYQGLLQRITPLLARSAVLVMAMCLALSPSCVPSLRFDWAASPSGSAAVAEFLTAAGFETRERLLPLRQLGDKKNADGKPSDVKQIVVLPGADLGDAEWAAFAKWLDDEDHTLILATGPRVLPDWLKTVEVVAAGAEGPVLPTESLGATAINGASAEGRVPDGAWVRTSVPANDVLLVRGAHSYALQAPNDIGRVIVFADHRLFTNASLVVAQNAALLAAVVGTGTAGAVEIVGQDTGVVAPTPMASLSRGRLAPFVSQLGVCLILFLLLQGRAFGRLADPRPVHRRAFSEHVAALGTQYARARAAGHVLTAYVTWTVDRLRERIRLSGDRGIGDLSEAIAARTNRPLGDVARVLFASGKDGDTAGADGSRLAVEQHLALMRELGQLLHETRAGTQNRTADRATAPSPKNRRTSP